MACSAVKMPSPVAVRSANCSLSSAALVASRLVVGDTSTVAVPAICDQPEVDPRGQLVGELLGGLLRGRHPVGLDIGGTHGLRHVDHQHHHRTVARDPDVVRRPRHRDGEQHQRQHQQDRRHVPPSDGPLRGDAFQQLHVGEPQHPPLARQLHRRRTARRARRRQEGTGRTTNVRSRTATSVRATAAVTGRMPMPVTAAPPWPRAGGTRRNGRCRRSSPGRCEASAAAPRSCGWCGRRRRGAPPRPWRNRHAAAHRW